MLMFAGVAACGVYAMQMALQPLYLHLFVGFNACHSCLHVLVFLATQVDFRKAKEKVLYKKKEGVPEGLYM